MTTLPLSEVEVHLPGIAEEVATTHERVQITKNRRDGMALVAVEGIEPIEATIELLGDPETQRRAAQAEADVRATCST